MGERRRVPRVLVLNPGKIFSAAVKSNARSAISLVSVHVWWSQAATDYPQYFNFSCEITAPQTCKVIWRDDTMLGVLFVVPATAAK